MEQSRSGPLLPLISGAVVFTVFAVAGFVVWKPAAFHPVQTLIAPEQRQPEAEARADLSQFAEIQRSVMEAEAEANKRFSFLKSLAEQLRPEDFQQVAQSSSGWPRREREAFLVALAHRWAAVDASAACTFFFTLEDADLRALAAGAVMDTWARKAPEEALQWLKAQPESVWRSEVLKRFSRITEVSDPKLAIVALDLLPEAQRDPDRRRRLALKLAVKDPRAAAEIVTAAYVGEPEREILSQITERWAQADFQGVLAYLQLPAEKQNRELAYALLSAIGSVNPQAALAWAKQVKGNRAPSPSALIISGWARKDPAAARAHATALPLGWERELAFDSLILELGTRRRDLPTLIALSREKSPLNDDQLLSYFPGLVKEDVFDFDKIADGIRSLPDDERNRHLLGGLVAVWSESQPEEAAAYLESHAPAAQNPFAIGAVAKAMAAFDPDRAIQWAMKLPEGEERNDTIADALQRLSSTDAERAWSLSQTHLPATFQRKVAAGVAGTLARDDIASAVGWADRLTDQASRQDAVGTIASVWAQRDVAACAQWLEQLEPGGVRDNAVVGFAFSAIREKPEAAFQWAETISDERRRTTVIHGLANAWHSLYPGPARRWINSTDLLSPSTKQWLLTTENGEW